MRASQYIYLTVAASLYTTNCRHFPLSQSSSSLSLSFYCMCVYVSTLLWQAVLAQILCLYAVMCSVNVHKYKIIIIDAMGENDACHPRQQQQQQ